MVDQARRKFLKSSALTMLSLSTVSCSLINFREPRDLAGIKPKLGKGLEALADYQIDEIISWGENLFSEQNLNYQQPQLNLAKQLYGYNNDYCAFTPLKGSSEHGVLLINHEYTLPELMFPATYLLNNEQEKLAWVQEAVGVSLFEVKKIAGKWQINKNSKYSRRITATNTLCKIQGYARGAERLKTSADPAGVSVYGTLANCAGGKTPWGTILTAEENFNKSFGGYSKYAADAKSHRAYKIKKQAKFALDKYYPRFDISKNPNEVNKFGYLVEIDPLKPNKPPVKRTSLGRYCHEGAAVTIDKQGYAVVYSGDDSNFEHLYKFVSAKKYDPQNPDSDILDEGTLYVAKFYESGSMEWLPLIYGQNGLTKAQGFYEESDIYIDTRLAAKKLGATKLDRPEGITICPQTGKIYVALTNNIKRLRSGVASPDAPNFFGYVLEINPQGDHHHREMSWRLAVHASKRGGIANPDNLLCDKSGNLWIATDGMEKTKRVSDSIYKLSLKNDQLTRLINTPLGSEVCGPELTPDQKTLFLCIQHPADGSDFAKPSTRWPHFKKSTPPLPTLIALSRKDGKII